MDKVLCLIIDSEPPEEAWREAYECHRYFWHRCLDACPWVDGFFIRSDPYLGYDSVVDGRLCTVRGEENWSTVLRKTIVAIGMLLSDHVYVVRTTVPSLYDFRLLSRMPPRNELYCGALVDDDYVTGSGILLSSDAARSLLWPHELNLSGWDDVDIGRILGARGIVPEHRDLFAFDFSKGDSQIEVGNHIHYRFRDYSDPTRSSEREAKAAVFDRIYGSKGGEGKRNVTGLGCLFEKYGTDKGRNGYTATYEKILDPIRREPLRILEIGIGTLSPTAFGTMVGFHGVGYAPGGSLRAFRDYCPGAMLLGLDVQEDTQFSEERIETGLCSSTDAVSVSRFFAPREDEQYDLVIDDGGHWPEMQIATLVNFHSKVREGGHYVIEDINGEDSYVFHFWHAIVGSRFEMVERRVNALVLRRSKSLPTGTSNVVEEFHKHYYDRHFNAHSWRGVPLQKCSEDLVRFQEIVDETRPEVVIETGVWKGGSTLFWADMLSLLEGDGTVYACDVSLAHLDARALTHPRVRAVLGSSVDDGVLTVMRKAACDKRTMVVLDSKHEKDHVLKELTLYGPLVSPGCFLIVEDTNLNGRPVRFDHGPGPHEAVEEFLASPAGIAFERDPRSAAMTLSFNPGGYLRRCA